MLFFPAVTKLSIEDFLSRHSRVPEVAHKGICRAGLHTFLAVSTEALYKRLSEEEYSELIQLIEEARKKEN